MARGYRARILLVVCSVVVAASRAEALPPEDEVWRALDSPSFALLGNATADELSLVARRLESLKAVLDRLGNEDGRAATRPIPVIVFRSASSFDPYRQGFGKGAKNVAGYYTEGIGSRFIAINVAAGDSPYPTVYHEYLHSVVREKFGRVPVWFNEGIAGVYETFTSHEGRAEVGRASRERLSYMTDHPWMTVAALIAVGNDTTLHDRDDEGTSAFYVHSWLLVHDILFGHPERQKQLANFLAAYARGTPHAEAFEANFTGGVAGMDAELRQYVRGRIPFVTITFEKVAIPAPGEAREVPRAEVLATLGRLLLITSDEDVSDAVAHYEAARALRPDDPAARAGLGLAAYRAGRFDEAAAFLDGAEGAGVEDSGALVVAARLALRQGAGVKARGFAARALAVTPNDADTLALFGATFVGDAEEGTQGIAALERADQIEPGRADVLTGLVALYARAGNRERAEATARRVEATSDANAKAHALESLAFLDLSESDEAVEKRDYDTAIGLLKAAREKTANETLRSKIGDRIARLEAASAAAKSKPSSKVPTRPAAKR